MDDSCWMDTILERRGGDLVERERERDVRAAAGD